jgi:hypothetical protein
MESGVYPGLPSVSTSTSRTYSFRQQTMIHPRPGTQKDKSRKDDAMDYRFRDKNNEDNTKKEEKS